MSSSVAVIDYGMGNLHSVAKALEHANDSVTVQVSSDPQVINDADRVVLPGVGAIRDCMAEIQRLNIDTLVKQAISEKPVMAICVGMQALMDHSEENDGVDCIGVFAGNVKFFGHNHVDNNGDKLKVPHMGWNTIEPVMDHPMWHQIRKNTFFYFVHSYYVDAEDEQQVAARCHYGTEFVAALTKPNVFATQFHPEKSHEDGLQLYRNFLSWDGTC